MENDIINQRYDACLVELKRLEGDINKLCNEDGSGEFVLGRDLRWPSFAVLYEIQEKYELGLLDDSANRRELRSDWKRLKRQLLAKAM